MLAATALGSGMAFLDGTVVNVALPSMGEDLNAEIAGLQWIVNGYMLMLASLILLSGSLGDRLGRRRMFVVGVIWFAVASVVCAVAPNLEVMIAGRVLQGIGGALLTPGSLAILQTSFRHSDRGKAVGTWSGLTSVAAAVGPFVGGSLVDSGSWRLIFLLNLPLAARHRAGHAPARPGDPRRDGRPASSTSPARSLATVGLAGLTYGLISAGDRGFGDPMVLTALAIGVVAFGGLRRGRAAQLAPDAAAEHLRQPPLHRREPGHRRRVRRSRHGDLPRRRLPADRPRLRSPLRPARRLLPMTVLMLTLSGYAGGLADRIGPRIPMTVGPALMAGGFLLMLRINAGHELLHRRTAAVVRARARSGRDRGAADRDRAVVGRGPPCGRSPPA